MTYTRSARWGGCDRDSQRLFQRTNLVIIVARQPKLLSSGGGCHGAVSRDVGTSGL